MHTDTLQKHAVIEAW